MEAGVGEVSSRGNDTRVSGNQRWIHTGKRGRCWRGRKRERRQRRRWTRSLPWLVRVVEKEEREEEGEGQNGSQWQSMKDTIFRMTNN